MRKLYFTCFFLLLITGVFAQSPFQRVYSVVNTKCQNAGCHSSTSAEPLKFDGTETAVYSSIFNMDASNASSVAKYEKLVKPQHPYKSFLLRKVAGASFDTDLAIDTTTEGALMVDITGNTLSNIEIEYIRQWTMFGAKETYATGDAQPDWQAVNDYYNNQVNPFLPKPPRPTAGTGMQLRMGPILLPITGAIEQEWLEQQEVDFPYLPQVTEIDGFMNDQSHHFLLFKYTDSVAATSTSASTIAPDMSDMALVALAGGVGITAFDGDKNLISAWQSNTNLVLPAGTAFMWEQKTWLDMNYHARNYNDSFVRPVDFYFNIYFQPRSGSTIPMLSHLVNATTLGPVNFSCFTGDPMTLYNIPSPGPFTQNHDDGDNNNTAETRYLWMAAGHTHKFGTAFELLVRDTMGVLRDTIYDGAMDYANNIYLGYWDPHHPPVEYWPTLYPVQFGAHGANNSGLVAQTTWDGQPDCIHFGLTTSDEMQLFYYMYTLQPLGSATGVHDNSQGAVYFEIMPNPMNHTGKLIYTLNGAAKVSACVVDITGKTIAQLKEENEDAGVYEITIGNNEKLSAGIYFAKLTVNGILSTKKFIVTE